MKSAEERGGAVHKSMMEPVRALSPNLLRLLFVCGGSYVSGREIVELAVMEGLQDRGHVVRCITSAWNDGDFYRRLNRAGISYLPVRLGTVSKSLQPKYVWWTINALAHLPKAWYDFRQELRRFAPDLVVISGIRIASMLRPLVDPGKTVLYVHEPPEATLHLRRVIEGPGNTGCSYIAVSNFIRARLIEQGVPEAKSHTVYNGAEPPRAFASAARADKLKCSTGRATSNEDLITVGIIGQVGAWKGHDDLIEALRLLVVQGYTLTCKIVGRGEDTYVRRLKQKIVQYGLADLVQWCGFVEDTSSIYASLDLCVVPSRFEEPFGLVALESAFQGLPVVATRRGGLPEVVVDGETGFLVRAERPEELADRIVQLINDPCMRRQMGCAARERALKHFTRNRMVDELDRLLQHVASTSELDFVRSPTPERRM